jgi:hypothetical protein
MAIADEGGGSKYLKFDDVIYGFLHNSLDVNI